jgi:DNA-binding MarR family transcriptional regulator
MNVSLKDQLLASMHRFKKVGRNFPPGFGLNMGEFFVMDRIGQDMPCSSTDISASEMKEHPHFTKPAVSQMLNSLEKKGYIHRDIDKKDRRKIVVTLTEKGEVVLKQGKQYFNYRLEETISRFGEDNTRQLISLVNLLTDITEDLRELPFTHSDKEDSLD